MRLDDDVQQVRLWIHPRRNAIASQHGKIALHAAALTMSGHVRRAWFAAQVSDHFLGGVFEMTGNTDPWVCRVLHGDGLRAANVQGGRSAHRGWRADQRKPAQREAPGRQAPVISMSRKTASDERTMPYCTFDIYGKSASA